MHFEAWRLIPEPPAPPAAPPTPATARLEVRANERTQVFFNGRALGTTPSLAPATVQVGLGLLELIHDRHGRMAEELHIEPQGQISVFVDWKRRQVRIEQGERDKPPSGKPAP